jgi:hypothetical protein
VAGPVIIVLVVVLALPPAFLVGGLIVSALIGWLGTEHAEATHEGSDLIELSR